MPGNATGEDAAAGLTAFLVAGVLMIASVAGILWQTQGTAGDASAVGDAAAQSEADALLEVIVDSPGHGWELGGDAVVRFGLRSPGTGPETGNGIQLQKIDLMRGGGLELNPDNGLLDYYEVSYSLGIPQDDDGPLTRQFHLRIVPLGLGGPGDVDLSHIQTAYIGDYAKLAKVTVATGSSEQIVQNAQVAVDTKMMAGTWAERQFLDDLGLDFDDRVFMTTNYPSVYVQLAPLVELPLWTMVDLTLWPGDVYPDDSQYLKGTLVSRLSGYDLLVVGSGVDQTALNSNEVKSAIMDFVLDGGILVVLGSAAANVQWLQPLFHVSTVTANGGAFANDAAHPLLTTPNALSWTGYPASGKAWAMGAQGQDVAAAFSHVVMAGSDDLLAVSNEGAYGEGRVFLTAYAPRDIAGLLGDDEAAAFLHNIIVYADQEELYLDFGPPVPDGIAVAAASRHTFIEDDDIGLVPVRVELLLWTG